MPLKRDFVNLLNQLLVENIGLPQRDFFEILDRDRVEKLGRFFLDILIQVKILK